MPPLLAWGLLHLLILPLCRQACQALTVFPPPPPVLLGAMVQVTWTSSSGDPATFSVFAKCNGAPATPRLDVTTSDGRVFVVLPAGFDLDVSAGQGRYNDSAPQTPAKKVPIRAIAGGLAAVIILLALLFAFFLVSRPRRQRRSRRSTLAPRAFEAGYLQKSDGKEAIRIQQHQQHISALEPTIDIACPASADHVSETHPSPTSEEVAAELCLRQLMLRMNERIQTLKADHYEPEAQVWGTGEGFEQVPPPEYSCEGRNSTYHPLSPTPILTTSRPAD
ncbi:hypothetical protein FPV67DRAFT_576461 [Lyophyllum atratum]|nr:hypothetical protein FPV67DRAFT_576461 [Lyophyllum atratum]